MARQPMQFSDVQKAEVETLAAVLSSEQIADYFGIGRRTFYDMMARDEEIAARYKRGKAKAIGAIAQGLITKARSGDTACMIFYLKTQGGWRETAVVEHATVPDDSTVAQRPVRQILLERLNALALRQQGVPDLIEGVVGTSGS
ncbi:hypothetical protein U879_13605 [Defluviimonas sp. 20V17]|uniref:Uncharacterized protein n=1 Tax=Allgaiera indica TaxID=765699 RepID=A0AAN4UQN3_9RHOB|nr:hypothetical protein [Allgaiera indica]KDB03145.1 hypothetical protein U879_13605 [Defluviimonas sp. 20V17]GHE00910.1 hypothetical protein GCM10008024_14430 [Allgaiera indica]SDW74303.1 hypothetical protein SAMN05444006_106134 [Allgaiera indica]